MRLHHALRAVAGFSSSDIPTDGLVAHYTMDNINGSTLVDEIGNYDGTINGATAVEGLNGNSLLFDSTSEDYVILNGTNTLYASSFSISFWFNSTSKENGIITAGNTRSSQDNRSFDIHGTGSDIRAVLSDGANFIGDVRTTFPSLNTWHHVVITCSGDTNSDGFKFYVNGNLESSSTLTSTSVNTDYDIKLGGGRHEPLAIEYFYDGLLDSTRIYNRELDSTEVLELSKEFE